MRSPLRGEKARRMVEAMRESVIRRDTEYRIAA
jgi:hypothetical protein